MQLRTSEMVEKSLKTPGVFPIKIVAPVGP